MSEAKSKTETQWAIEWLDEVAGGANTMSQRKLSVIERRGGLEAVKALAKERGIIFCKSRTTKAMN